jgi:hypothetical protein
MKLDVSVATTLLFLSLLNSGAFYIHHKLSLNLFTFYFASSVHFLTLFCMCRSIGRSANRHFIGERSLHAQCYLRTKHATKNILFQCTVHFSSPDIQHFGRVVGFIGAANEALRSARYNLRRDTTWSRFNTDFWIICIFRTW